MTVRELQDLCDEVWLEVHDYRVKGVDIICKEYECEGYNIPKTFLDATINCITATTITLDGQEYNVIVCLLE